MHPNEVLGRRWFQEVWNERRIEAADGILCDSCAATDMHSGVGRSKGELKELYARLQERMPELQFTVEDAVADDDRVALRWRARGSAIGPSGPVAVDISGLSFARIEGGKATRIWDAWDKLGLLQQLGHVPRELDPTAM
ncbi:putative ester cyclase [Inquilinus ginsengisoli]|uniref:Ester cyclase n=1 Tax=Inquilinus ginsengisoli TaxID=363840 RepID=A0ABU1JY93_9PROT|nr:ester cyclase [Inquilinus ginsengisoli]MDR6293590.1 putative ester cyclase [Inquilinus ginsengisoli]